MHYGLPVKGQAKKELKEEEAARPGKQSVLATQGGVEIRRGTGIDQQWQRVTFFLP